MTTTGRSSPGSAGKRVGPRRVRLLLLVLLWVWALTIFMTVDLFLNVQEFDAVRPRAPFYRSLRVAGHQLVGEPYREDDPVDHNRRLVRHRRGTDVLGGERTADAVLSSAGSRDPEEVAAVLRRCQESPDAALANALLEARRQIPEELLGEYGLAAASVVAKLCATHEDTPPGASALPLLGGLGNDLTLAALDAHARRLEADPSGLGPRAWRSARVTVERIAWVAPGFDRAQPHAAALDRVRASVERFVGRGRAGTSSDTEVEALRLAAAVGNASTAAACVDFVRRRSLPGRTREGFLALEYAIRTVVRSGQGQHRIEMQDRVAKSLANTRDVVTHRRLERLYRLLLERFVAPDQQNGG